MSVKQSGELTAEIILYLVCPSRSLDMQDWASIIAYLPHFGHLSYTLYMLEIIWGFLYVFSHSRSQPNMYSPVKQITTHIGNYGGKNVCQLRVGEGNVAFILLYLGDIITFHWLCGIRKKPIQNVSCAFCHHSWLGFVTSSCGQIWLAVWNYVLMLPKSFLIVWYCLERRFHFKAHALNLQAGGRGCEWMMNRMQKRRLHHAKITPFIPNIFVSNNLGHP